MSDIALKPTNINIGQFFQKLFFMLPIIGPMVREVKEGGEGVFIIFLLNVAMLWIMAGIKWGLMGVVGGAYVMLPLYAMVFITLMIGKQE